MNKIKWTKPELETLNIEETLSGPNNTPVETSEDATGNGFGGPDCPCS